MSRRPANAIELMRLRSGLTLGELVDQVPPGEGPSSAGYMMPLPSVARGSPAPYSRPLPELPGSPLWNPPEPSDSGAIDYNARQAAQLDDVPKGATAEPSTVYPAWESRMEGMRDFLSPLVVSPDYAAVVPAPGPMFFTSFEVPQGFTAIWKAFRFFFDPVPADVSTVDLALITLLVDGITVPNFWNIPIGAFMADYQETFVIAGEGRRLTVRLDLGALGGGNIDTTVFVPHVLLYGNLRPRTGEAEKSEVGMRPPPPVVVAPAPAPIVATPAPPRPNFLRPGAMPAPPPPQGRVFGHGERPDPNDRGGNRNPPAGRRR